MLPKNKNVRLAIMGLKKSGLKHLHEKTNEGETTRSHVLALGCFAFHHLTAELKPPLFKNIRKAFLQPDDLTKSREEQTRIAEAVFRHAYRTLKLGQQHLSPPPTRSIDSAPPLPRASGGSKPSKGKEKGHVRGRKRHKSQVKGARTTLSLPPGAKKRRKVSIKALKPPEEGMGYEGSLIEARKEARLERETRLSETKNSGQLTCLCLGLSFVNKEDGEKYPLTHVVRRDRERLIALQNLGFSPYTISLPEIGEKHSSERAPGGGRRRVHGRFGRRVVEALIENYREGKPFDAVFLEYIRMPGDYGRIAFNSNMWGQMLPTLLQKGLITKATPIFVYNEKEIQDNLREANRLARELNFDHGYLWEAVNGESNGLFLATNHVDHLLPMYGNTNWMKKVNLGTFKIDPEKPFLKVQIQDFAIPSSSSEEDSDSDDEDEKIPYNPPRRRRAQNVSSESVGSTVSALTSADANAGVSENDDSEDEDDNVPLDLMT